MKKIMFLIAISIALIPSCKKDDARNIIVGANYTVVSITDLETGEDMIVSLFGHAPRIDFKMKRDNTGMIVSDNSYSFAWKYTDSKYQAIEIEFQNPMQYDGSTEKQKMLQKMSGNYDMERTNGLRISPHAGIDMSNGKVRIQMART